MRGNVGFAAFFSVGADLNGTDLSVSFQIKYPPTVMIETPNMMVVNKIQNRFLPEFAKIISYSENYTSKPTL